jgi:hypothetical protein
MITRLYHIEFLTPAFSAGANQAKAELRPASIRGALRWWFRALGGSLEEEESWFGSVRANHIGSSKLAVRVQNQPAGGQPDWHTAIQPQGMDRSAYLLGFFCGKTGRLQSNGAIPPGSKATVSVILHRPASLLLNLTFQTFFSMGGFGFRATRTAGSFETIEHKLGQDSWNILVGNLEAAGFTTALLPAAFPSWIKLVDAAGSLLKHRIRSKSDGLGISAGKNGTTPNALGSASPRQASVLHFRAVRIDGLLRLALLEPPHNRILGQRALRAHGSRGSIIQEAGLDEA